MPDILRIIIFVLVGLGLGELAALVAILFRHAIPRAPLAFHVLLILPMLLASSSCFGLAWIGLSGEEALFSIDALVLLFVFFASEALVYWILVSYAVYNYLYGREPTLQELRTQQQDLRDVQQGEHQVAQDARDQRQSNRGAEQDRRGEEQDKRDREGH